MACACLRVQHAPIEGDTSQSVPSSFPSLPTPTSESSLLHSTSFFLSSRSSTFSFHITLYLYIYIATTMSGFFGISKFGSKTKPKRSSSAVRPLFLCQPYCNSSIVKGNFKTIVQLPKYVDANEWLAINVFDFYNYINMFYGSISDFCTARDCQSMTAGPGCEYMWVDQQKKNIKVPAPQYIDFVMSWIQSSINDENVFPTKEGRDFPPNFQQTVRAMFKQLIRVFAHVYHHHYDKMLCLCQEGHLNSLFAHFVSFGREFDLLDKKDLTPLQELVDIMESNGILC